MFEVLFLMLRFLKYVNSCIVEGFVWKCKSGIKCDKNLIFDKNFLKMFKYFYVNIFKRFDVLFRFIY